MKLTGKDIKKIFYLIEDDSLSKKEREGTTTNIGLDHLSKGFVLTDKLGLKYTFVGFTSPEDSKICIALAYTDLHGYPMVDIVDVDKFNDMFSKKDIKDHDDQDVVASKDSEDEKD